MAPEGLQEGAASSAPEPTGEGSPETGKLRPKARIDRRRRSISEEAPELSGEGAAREDLLDLGVQQLLKNLLREKLPLEPQRTFLKTIKGSTHCRPCQSGRAGDTCDGRRHLSRTFVRPCSRNSGDSMWGSFFRGTQFSRNSLSRSRSS